MYKAAHKCIYSVAIWAYGSVREKREIIIISKYKSMIYLHGSHIFIPYSSKIIVF